MAKVVNNVLGSMPQAPQGGLPGAEGLLGAVSGATGTQTRKLPPLGPGGIQQQFPTAQEPVLTATPTGIPNAQQGQVSPAVVGIRPATDTTGDAFTAKTTRLNALDAPGTPSAPATVPPPTVTTPSLPPLSFPMTPTGITPATPQGPTGITPVNPGSSVSQPINQPITNDPLTGNGQGGVQIPSVPTGITPVVPDSTAPSTGNAITDFGPGNDLVGSQINPQQTAREATTAGQVDTAAQSLANAPDRGQIALDYLKNLDQQQANQRQLGIQDIGRSAAKFGRIGSGVVTTSLGDLQSQLNQQREQSLRQLAADAASGTMSDNLNRLGALSGLEGQQFGQNQSARNELRTERGYQYGLSQDALNQQIQNRLLQDQLLNSATNRGVSVAGANQSLSNQYGQQAAAGQDAISQALATLGQEYARSQAANGKTLAPATPTTTTPTAANLDPATLQAILSYYGG